MRLSIDVYEVFAPRARAPRAIANGAIANGTRQWNISRTGRLALSGLAAWAVASTLQPALQSVVAAPPTHRHHHASTSLPAPQRPTAQHHTQHQAPHSSAAFKHGSLACGGSVSAAKKSGGCSVCGKKRKSLARKFLDGVTAGTDRLIFGSCYPESCDCDFGGETGCDTGCDAIGLTPFPAGTDRRYAPRAAAPGLDLLPAPGHQPPIPPRDGKTQTGAPGSKLPGSKPPGSKLPGSKPPGSRHATPELLTPEHPTSNTNRDQQRDPFGDDPVYQGTNPAISRSAYYE